MYYHLLLPLKLDWLPVYSAEHPLRIGERVQVMFSHREYTAVVWKECPEPEMDARDIRPVLSEHNEIEDISPQEMALWDFVSSYYMCSLGQVYAMAQPKFKALGERVLKKALKQYSLESSAQDSKAAKGSGALGSAETEKPLLLMGSGRAEFYCKSIAECLEKGKSALVLAPEREGQLALREEIGKQLPQAEESIVLYDTSLSMARRRDIELCLKLGGKPLVVIGLRSALFLSFSKLGLVIVDNEHDALYKQSEPVPYYNARDLAAVLARIHSSGLILGSECPSLESLYNCSKGKWLLKRLPYRAECELQIIDIAAEKRKRGMKGDFSIKMLEEIERSREQIRIVRSFLSEEAAAEQCISLLPGRDPQILSARQAAKASTKVGLCCILNADSLFDAQDFRSDEKALQLLCSLSLRCDKLIVQSRTPEHPVFGMLRELLMPGNGFPLYASRLLGERQQFKLPPFVRLLDIKDPKTSMLVKRIGLDNTTKEEISLKYGKLYKIDVDPI